MICTSLDPTTYLKTSLCCTQLFSNTYTMEGEVTSDVENYKVSASPTSPKKSRPRRLFKSLSFKSSSFLSRRTKSSPQVDEDCSRDCNVQSSGKFWSLAFQFSIKIEIAMDTQNRAWLTKMAKHENMQFFVKSIDWWNNLISWSASCAQKKWLAWKLHFFS